ncbi:MAG: hypothetical protein BMS9Abin30_0817 [Gammaproteobacteria bacterium]|nr:MAG: hypothetical protein BMS9Abin30_0817 [Gammaproteobacteria bacterium]
MAWEFSNNDSELGVCRKTSEFRDQANFVFAQYQKLVGKLNALFDGLVLTPRSMCLLKFVREHNPIIVAAIHKSILQTN